MRIIVISDTHVLNESELSQNLLDDISNADHVIHAGDLITQRFYDDLIERNHSVYAVKGNNDKLNIPRLLTIELGGVKIAVIHSDGAGVDRTNYLLYTFHHFYPDIIVYGHTHKPSITEINKITLFNPGSPTNNRGASYNSYGIIEISNDSYSINTIRLP